MCVVVGEWERVAAVVVQCRYGSLLGEVKVFLAVKVARGAGWARQTVVARGFALCVSLRGGASERLVVGGFASRPPNRGHGTSFTAVGCEDVKK